MDCAALRERVAPLLDGDLDPIETRAAHEHLRACAECAALVEKLGAIPMPGPQPRIGPEADFWSAMDRALEAEAHRPVPWHRRTRAWLATDVRLSRGVVALYVALLAAAFVWHLVTPSPSPTPEIAQPAVLAPAAESAGPAPAPSPPRQRVEKASYAPVQQMY